MAVYTKVSDTDLSAFLADYTVGAARTFKGIAEGVENSNFYLETDGPGGEKGRFILTLYEKRVNREDLPFFLGLMDHLVEAGLPTARPVADRDGTLLKELNGKPAALIEFVDGVSKHAPDRQDCTALGAMLARLHEATRSFDGSRANDLSLSGWQALADTTAPRGDDCAAGLSALLDEEMTFLNANWPTADTMPAGVIHADLFPDNVLFTGYEITGIIDFYFSCTDFYAYDLAVCLLSWCFDEERRFQTDKASAMVAAYEEVRPLSAVEKQSLPVLARGASLRFLLTRLHDWLHQEPNALVTVKDPTEYADKTRALRDIDFSAIA